LSQNQEKEKTMSLSKFESEVKHLRQSPETAYALLADLRNLQGLKEKLNDPAVTAAMAGQLPADKMEEARRQLDRVEFDRDSVQIDSPMGRMRLAIVERDAPKCLKFAGEGAPLQLYLWIQLLPCGTGAKMRVTVGAEVNIFMKGMVSKPLQQAADGLAGILAAGLDGLTGAAGTAPAEATLEEA